MADARLPVTVITGYLGAGKTTLVNHLLGQTERRLAVVVNEFGEAGIDGSLIETGDEDLVELSSGCVCCVVRGDLIRTLRRLLEAEGRYDGIVIETTGLANPAPVIQTFFADQVLAAQCRLDGVVTVADAIHAPGQLAAHRDAVDQVALASVIVLNKAGESPDPGAVEARLRAINPAAPILRAERGRVRAADILDTGGFDLDRVAGRLAESGTEPDHVHAHGIGSVTLSATRPFDAEALEAWLGDLLAVRGEDILRTKGLIWVQGEPRQLALQAVHMLLEGDFAAPWEGPEPHLSRLVFIGRDLDAERLRAGFLACTAQPVPGKDMPCPSS